jgi:hypothetical protein
LNFRKILALSVLALPVCGQYAGPAVLARGEAPAAMVSPAVRFQPFAEITSIYDTGLARIGTFSNSGNLANAASFGMGIAWGISGSKAWRRTTLGLDYRGNLDRYTQRVVFNTTTQQFLLSLNQTLTRHVSFTLRSSGGTFARDFGLRGISSTVAFDPTTASVPRTDFFDNRTSYLTAQGDLTYQRSARLSINIGGDGSIIRREYTALFGTVTAGARADVHYRLGRRTTIGGAYFYEQYRFTRILGGSDIHTAVGAFGMRLSRRLEFTGYAGIQRVESKVLQTTLVDPIIGAILGITGNVQIVHQTALMPDINARLSRTFRTGLLYLAGSHNIVPGNGLFLTSSTSTILGGYSYTGLRNWSFSSSMGYYNSDSMVHVAGNYGTLSAGVSLSRKLGRSFYVIGKYFVRDYSSNDFDRYQRLIHEARLGIGFTPGNVPLRIW